MTDGNCFAGRNRFELSLAAVSAAWRLSLLLGLLLSFPGGPASVVAQEQRLPGHGAGVNAVIYSPDGRYLLSGSADQTIKIRNAATGDELRTLRGHTAQVLTLATDPAGRQLVSGSADNTLRLWDIPQAEPFYSAVASPGPLVQLAIDPLGEKVLVVGEDRLPHLLNLADGALLESLQGHDAALTGAAFRGDNQQFVTADAAGRLLFWRAFDNAQRGRIDAHRGAVVGVAYHPSNQQLITAGADGLLKTWQLPLVDPRVLPEAPGPVRCAEVTANGQLLVTAGNGHARVYTVATGALARELATDVGNSLSLALSGDSLLAAAGDEQGRVKFWAINDGADRAQLEAHVGSVLATAFHPDNQRIATASDDGVIRLWSLPQPRLPLAGHTAAVLSTAVSPNGTYGATASADHSVRLWTPSTGAALRTLAGHASPVTSTAFKADSTQFATTDDSGVLRLWNPADGVEQAVWGAHPTAANSAAFHPAGDRLATAGADGTIKVWRLPAVAPRTLAGHTSPVADVAVSADGAVVLSGGEDKTVRLFNGATGAALRTLAGQGEAVSSLALSADATLAASGSVDGVIQLWNAADGADRLQLRGHTGPVLGLAMSPQGDLLASAGADQSVRLWRLPVAPTMLAGHTAPVSEVVATTSGELVATGSADKGVRLWNHADGTAAGTGAVHQGAVAALAAGMLPAAGEAKAMEILASGDDQGELQLWDVAGKGSLGSALAHVGGLTGLTFTPTGDRLISTGADGSLKWWRLPLQSPTTWPATTGEITAVVTAADGSFALVGSADKSVRLFDLQAEAAPVVLAAGNGPVTSLALRRDKTLAAIGDAEGVVRFVDPAAPPAAADSVPPPALAGHAGPVLGAAFNATGDRLATASADGVVRVWSIPQPSQVYAGDATSTRMTVSRDGKFSAAAAVVNNRPAVVIRNTTTGQVIQQLFGHDGAVLGLAFSENGLRLATGSADQTARVWDLADPKFPEIQRVSHGAAVAAVALSPDGQQLFSGGADNAIKQWAVADGAEVRTLAGHTGALTAMCAVGDLLVSGAADSTARTWKLSTGAAIGTLAQGAAVTSVAASPDAQLVAVGGAGKTIKLWKAVGGAAAGELTGHAGPIASLTFSAEGGRLVSSSTDGVRLWSTSGLLEDFLPLAEPAPVGAGFGATAANLPPRLLIGAADNSLRAADSALVQAFAGHDGAVNAIAFSPDGALLLTAGADKTLRIWPLAAGGQPRSLAGHTDAATAIAIDPTGKTAASASNDKTVRLWNLADGAQIASYPFDAPVRSLAFSPGGARLAATSDDAQLRVLDLPAGRELQRVTLGAMPLLSVAFAGEDRIVAGGADKLTYAVPLQVERVVAAAETGVLQLAASADGQRLATLDSTGTMSFWNANGERLAAPLLVKGLVDAALRPDGLQWAGADATGKVLFGDLTSLPATAPAAPAALPAPVVIETGSPVHRVAYNGAGSKLAAATTAGGRVYDPTTHGLLETAPTTGPMATIAFGAAGEQLLYGEANQGAIRPLNLVRLLAGHTDAATAVAFTGDGALLLSASADKTVRLWRRETGEPVPLTFAGPTGALHDVAVSIGSADSPAQVVAGGEEGKAFRWVLPAALPAAAATLQPTAVYDHGGPLRSVALSADAARLVAAGDDKIVRLWDTASGAELERWTSHTAAVQGVAMTPDGGVVVSGGADNGVQVASVSAIGLRSLAATMATQLAYLPTGELAAACGDGKVRVWDAEEKESVLDAGVTGPLVGLALLPALAPEGFAQAAALDSQGGIHVWNLKSGEQMLLIKGPAPATPAVADAVTPRGLTWSADRLRLAAAGFDGKLRVYEATTGMLLETFSPPEKAPFVTASFLPDSRTLLVGGAAEAGNAAVLHVSALGTIAAHEGAVNSLAFTPDGASLVSGGADQMVRLWNTADGVLKRSFQGAEKAITDVAVSADGKSLAAASEDQSLRIWSVAPVAVEPAVPADPADPAVAADPLAVFTGESATRSVSFSADGLRLASSADDGVVRVWDLASGKELERFAGHEGAVHAVDFGADSKTLVSAGEDLTARIWTIAAVRAVAASAGPLRSLGIAAAGAQAATIGSEPEVRLWNLADGALVRSYPAGESPLTAVAVRADNAQLVASDETDKVFLWNLADAVVTTSFQAPSAVRDLQYSPDNLKIAALGGDDRIRFLNPADGETLFELESPAPLAACRFTADSRRLATVGSDGAARLWAYASPDPVRQFNGHGNGVYGVAWSPNREQIASASGDQTIRLWNPLTGQQQLSLTGHQGAVYAVAYSPDGALLVSCGADKTIRLWDVLGGRQLKSIDVGEAAAYSVQFHPDGKRVVAGGLDKQVHLYDAFTGQLLSSIPGHEDYIYRVTFNKAGTRVLTCGYGGSVAVWNVANGAKAFSARPCRSASYVEYSPDGEKAAVASGDGAVYLLEIPAAAR
ncbi:WD40 repeat domain-containing protein [Lignipirellula cremea]|uniref:WD domain, G-beta repeat n=1 Tax=Lignipirellula cremea TaxID=2528010 RepID=A0A518DXR0_9BACT|nr:WD40 repeat domain-containing protein [Lignipirellula cremea]QDU96637.1 WD domain, G-beta repeat [Lignipirellula cremea]